MSLSHPEYLPLFFLILPLAALLFFAEHRALKNLLKFAPRDRQVGYRRYFAIKTFFSRLFFLLALVSVGLQIVGLSWDFETQPSYEDQLEIAFVVDVSPSMLVMEGAASRLETVRGGIYSALPALRGSWFSLVVFRGSGLILQPLSQNQGALRNLVGLLHPSMVTEPGSNLTEGLMAAYRALSVPSNRRKVMAVFSDFEVEDRDFASALRLIREAGIKILWVGAGRREGGRVPDSAGGWVKDAEGLEVVSRFNERLFQHLANLSGVDSYHLGQGGVGLAQQLSLYKNPGFLMAVRPRATGSLFLGLSILFLVLSWLVRVIKWRGYF